mmetsp:Transcript_158168/g.503633  ORF Transcript_158168/g.503633 Transcript_158168/m.503633 type:complete len:217 (-) Transcript_158168:95-745(-)
MSGCTPGIRGCRLCSTSSRRRCVGGVRSLSSCSSASCLLSSNFCRNDPPSKTRPAHDSGTTAAAAAAGVEHAVGVVVAESVSASFAQLCDDDAKVNCALASSICAPTISSLAWSSSRAAASARLSSSAAEVRCNAACISAFASNSTCSCTTTSDCRRTASSSRSACRRSFAALVARTARSRSASACKLHIAAASLAESRRAAVNSSSRDACHCRHS